jgi:cell wall-associated NlpC family hydrolase
MTNADLLARLTHDARTLLEPEGEGLARRLVQMQVCDPVAPIRQTPAPDGPMLTQLLFGEGFELAREVDGWAYGRSTHDGYIGWVDLSSLSGSVLATTHTVSALRTYAYSAPSLKAPPHGLLSLNAKLSVEAQEGRYLKIARLGWVFEGHVRPRGQHASDPVALAEAMIGTPYFWGGKETLGLDCSGLVQIVLEAAGLACLRDSDMQEATLGEEIGDGSTATALRRGDLVFWKGHVGLMADETRLIHANAHHMAVTCEQLRSAIVRISSSAGPVTRIRRLPDLNR